MCVFTSDGLVGYTPQETQQSSPSLHIRKATGDMGRRADEALFKPTKTNRTQNKKLQTKNDGFIPILARSSCTNFSLILGLARIQRVEKSCTQEPTYCSRRCLRQGLKIQPHNNCCLQLMILNSLFFNPKSSPLLPTTVYLSHTQNPKSKNIKKYSSPARPTSTISLPPSLCPLLFALSLSLISLRIFLISLSVSVILSSGVFFLYFSCCSFSCAVGELE
jgi:hypothetical protein